MKLRNQQLKYGRRFAPVFAMAGEGEGGDGAGGEGDGQGGGSGSGAISMTPEELQAKIDEATSGLKSKNKELLDTVKSTKDALKPWEGLDPEKVKGFMTKLEKDEELKLLAEGKTDEAFQRRLERVNADHQSQLENVSQERDKYQTELEKAQSQVRDLIIDQQVISSFMAEKGHESAAPDVVNRAKAAFTIEDGEPIARDSKGEIIRGKDGPITIQEWVTNLKDAAPHLFPGSSGAGATGSGGSGSRSSLDARMQEAADAGNMKEYKRLRDEKAKAAG
jgi:hypothetical protein